jgi:hypothetical protein
MGQTPTSKSAAVNNAAKDDTIYHSQGNDDGSFDLSLITANDPGSAVFKGFLTDGVTLNDNGTFSFDNDFTGTFFQYQVRMANGTYSTATVHFGDHLSDVNLIVNGSFTDDGPSAPYQTYTSVTGWQTLSGSAHLEVVVDGYQGISGGQGAWLDTQGSTGGIDIKQAVDVGTGAHAMLSFDLSAEQFPPAWQTAAGEQLQVIWNGQVVGTISQADLGDHNVFHTFSYEVEGAAGADTVEFHSIGANTFVGMALTDIELHQWVV